MGDSIFDKHFADYNKVLAKSLGLTSDDGCDFFDNYKVDFIEGQFTSKSRYRILDFGCGIGKLSVLLAKTFSNSQVFGYDISEKTLLFAQKSNDKIPNLSFINNLSVNQQYDIILGANVFHHVKKSERYSTLKKINKLLQPNGTIIIFEHNPFNPLTRYIVNRCPFDVDAELISRQEFVKLTCHCGLGVKLRRYVVMFPWDFKIFRIIERIFSQVPFGAQYVLLLTKASG